MRIPRSLRKKAVLDMREMASLTPVTVINLLWVRKICEVTSGQVMNT